MSSGHETPLPGTSATPESRPGDPGPAPGPESGPSPLPGPPAPGRAAAPGIADIDGNGTPGRASSVTEASITVSIGRSIGCAAGLNVSGVFVGRSPCLGSTVGAPRPLPAGSPRSGT